MQRVSNACDACKAARCKCNGDSPCDGCTKRGLSCVYTANRKRGPLPSSKSRALIAPVHTRDAQKFSSTEHALLRNFFAVINPALMVVEEMDFYASLQALDSRSCSADMNGSSGVLACAYMMLSVSAKLLGDEPGSQRYLEEARTFMDLAMRALPNQFLVSALLISYILPPTTASPVQALMQVRYSCLWKWRCPQL
jgi:hypothetical protein